MNANETKDLLDSITLGMTVRHVDEAGVWGKVTHVDRRSRWVTADFDGTAYEIHIEELVVRGGAKKAQAATTPKKAPARKAAEASVKKAPVRVTAKPAKKAPTARGRVVRKVTAK